MDPISQSTSHLILATTDDVQLLKLIDWANTTTWCSRAVLETYNGLNIISGILTDLIVDEYDHLTIPENAVGNTTYVSYSDIIDFVTDENEEVEVNTDSSLWAFQISTKRYGNSHIKLELSTNPSSDILYDSEGKPVKDINGNIIYLSTTPTWFVLYDTSITGAVSSNYPNGFLDYSRYELSSGIYDIYGNHLTNSASMQVKVSITTDSGISSAYVDYYGIIANPSIF